MCVCEEGRGVRGREKERRREIGGERYKERERRRKRGGEREEKKEKRRGRADLRLGARKIEKVRVNESGFPCE